ncbi:MAG: hypothetical protein PVH98_09990 [Gammaproteobacteria bacterium]|jgi:hypothetical protein
MKLKWITIGLLLVLSSAVMADDDQEDLGVPECELIVGVNRYIEIGNTISYTIDYMEQNKYRCDEFRGKAHEIVSCSYNISPKFEVLLVVDNGVVTEIETFQNGAECTYFNVKPAPRVGTPGN